MKPRKSLGVKKSRQQHDTASSHPSLLHTPIPSLFACSTPRPSPSFSDATDSLPLDQLRLVPKTTSTPSLNPFAVSRPSPSIPALSPLTLSGPSLTRTHSKPLCPLFSSTPSSHPRLVLGDKRKRSLSKDFSINPSPPPSPSPSAPPIKQKNDPSPPLTSTDEDTADFIDNGHFTLPPFHTSTTCRKSLPEAPRKKRTQGRMRGKGVSARDDISQPHTIIDMTSSPNANTLPLSPLPPPPHSSPVVPHLQPVGGVQLHFSSQGSQDDPSAFNPDTAIVYASQEEDDVLPTQEAPAPAPAAHQPSSMPTFARQLARSSSIASAGTQSQCEDYCTPMDQPIRPRTDEERALDILNARQLVQATAASAIPLTSHPISVNPFLPFALRHTPHPKPPMMLPPPTSRLLTDYEILRMVGEGSFGCVMQCRHRLDGTLYAVKRMKRVGVKGGEDLRECWAAAAVASAGALPPTLLHYHTTWYEDHHLYIAIEWCEGLPLTSRLTHPHTPLQLTGFLLSLASALHHLHRLGYAHLDVKPDNILCLPPVVGGGEVRYKLIDYGMMHRLSSHPQVLGGVGDRRYLGPEGVGGEDEGEGLDRWDVWALGVVALEMKLGRRLDEGERERLRREGWAEEGGVGGGVGGTVGQVMEGMMRVDLWQRMDAEEVVRKLQDGEGGGQEEHVSALEARVGELTTEVGQWRARCEAAEREREVARERAAALDGYVQQVQRHMAALT